VSIQPRRPRRVSTGTWRGLSAPARADLWASDYLRSGEPGEPSGLESIELMFDASFLPEHQPALRALATRAFLAGTEREAQLESALEAALTIRARLENLLRERGIPVPTDPLPSDPPERT
jgi:hypothetical protein